MIAAVEGTEASPALALAVAVGLLVLAVGMFFLEALVPSFGLITLFGIGCIVGAIILAFSVSTAAGIAFCVLSAASIPLAVALVVKILKKTSFILDSSPAEASSIASDTWRPQPGMRGVAATPLRPAGTAIFDGRRVSVVTTGDMIEPNEQIEVVEVDGTKIVVRPVKV